MKNLLYQFGVLFSLFIIGINTSTAQNPSVNFTVDQHEGCSPLSIQFTCNNSNVATYHWTFGNGNTSTMPNPSNVYVNPGQYTVKLVVIFSSGQKDSSIVNNMITVAGNPTADFYSNNTEACLNVNSFHFENTSTNSVNWLWDFGDGITSTQENPQHSYASPGTYTVKLIAYNSTGCQDIAIKSNYIIVHPLAQPVFACNDTLACDPTQPFTFTSSTDSAVSWQWQFGDGTSSSIQNPNHTYNAPGNYSVTLITANSYGCSDTTTKSNYVHILNLSAPSILSNVTSGCPPLTVSFHDTSSTTQQWLWKFGDGDTSSQQQPQHIYQTPGNYTVSLTLKTQNGCTATINKPDFITVSHPPVVNFTYSDSIGCAPLSVNFINQSQNTSQWHWNFGDGASSNQENPTHTFLQPGIFNVVLNATSPQGCTSSDTILHAVNTEGPVAHFNANQTSSCAPFQATFNNTSTGSTHWKWFFGDGDSSFVQNPTHTYQLPGDYTVTLYAFNDNNCSYKLVKSAYIHAQNTTAGFVTPPTIKGCAPYSVSFSDATTGAYAWLWNFGDSTTSTQQHPTHTYTKPGHYIVSLTVEVPGQCTKVYHEFRKYDIEGSNPGFVVQPLSCSPFEVSFTDTTSGVVSQEWNFGDGNSSSDQNPTHTYVSPQYYTVSLTTTTSEGCSNTIIMSHIVHPAVCDTSGGNNLGLGFGGNIFGGNDTINAQGDSDFIAGCAPMKVNFSNVFAGTISWSWDFGDGTNSNEENPTHIYTTAGIYSVQLIALDHSGQSDTAYFHDYIRVNAVSADFSITSGLNDSISLTNLSQGANSWLWNFGDNSSSSVMNPNHDYADSLSDNYSITLTAYNNAGCSSSTSKNFFAGNTASIWADKYISCTYLTVNFFSSPTNFASYHWDFGDSTTSSQSQPHHTYAHGGSYMVTLNAIDSSGKQIQITLPQPVVVEEPIPDYSTTQSSDCDSLSVAFTNLSTGCGSPLHYYSIWHFGDGNIGWWQSNASHTYSEAGSYNVSLTVYSTHHCHSSISKTITVGPPLVNFSFTQDKQCFPITATYSDSSTDGVSWLWNFGDGTTSTQQNPVHIFTSAPDSVVTLTVTNAHGCSTTISKPNIQYLNGKVIASATTGCTPFNVQFSCISPLATSWSWHFGDGDTSAQEAPQHIYNENGSYNASVIIQSANGCSDTLSLPTIQSGMPVVSFNSPTPANCAPSVVSFVNTSTGSVAYHWDFGDGSFSTQKNPTHIYNAPGEYSVKLIAKNQTGCADSIVKTDYIKVLGPVVNFSASVNDACPGANIVFNGTGSNIAGWKWNFGDGDTANVQQPSHTYPEPGQYTISLIVNDSIGCQAHYSMPVNIHHLPSPVFSTDKNKGCAPLTVHFNNQSNNITSYSWHFGDGTVSTSPDPSHLFQNAGAYNISLKVTDSLGCTDSTTFSSIVVHPHPQADFSVQNAQGCPPLSVSFTNTSPNSQGSQWLWEFNNGLTSNAANPTITFNQPGSHNATLIMTDQYGCSDTLKKINLITVNDTAPPAPNHILTASVTSNSTVYLLWDAANTDNFGGYEIYRKNNQTGLFENIATITDPNTVSYTDTALNTLSNVYCYKIRTVNACEKGLSLRSLPEYHTINVTATRMSSGIKVSWTPYVGCDVYQYEIYRVGAGNNNPGLIATVSGQTLSYIDSDLYCPIAYSYRIKATKLCGNPLSAYSDTAIAQVSQEQLASTQIKIIRSSVIDNNSVITEWKTPTSMQGIIGNFLIYRSTDNLNFSLIDSVNGLASSYIDHNVHVNEQNYYYKIEATTSCGKIGLSSNNGSSILLKTNLVNGQVQLNWTGYNGWNMGVDHYVIEKWVDGQWKPIKIIDGNTLQYIDEQ